MNNFSFWAGGGEMGERTRAHDWSTTSLGPPGQWPQSLRTTLSIVLNSRFPMFLYWGDDHICFHNDAYTPSLGTGGRQSTILGKPAREGWADIWTEVEPVIDKVRRGGGASYVEDLLLPIWRDGQLAEVYWTASYSPVLDENDRIAGVFATCFESTAKVLSLKQLEASKQRLDSLFMQVNAGIFQTDAAGQFIDANDSFCQLVGYGRTELRQKTAGELIHPDDALATDQLMQTLLSNGTDFLTTRRYVHKKGTPVWVNSSVARITNPDGSQYITDVVIDISAEKEKERQVQRSEARFRDTVMQAPVAMAVFRGGDFVAELANDAYLKLIDKSRDELTGQPLFELFPNEEAGLRPAAQRVVDTGTPYTVDEFEVTIQRRGVAEKAYFTFAFSPLHDADRAAGGIIVVIHELTEQVLTRQRMADSEARFRTLIEQNPVGTALYTGAELRIDVANDIMIGYWGKGPDVLGKLRHDVLPEVLDQPFTAIMNHVFATGETVSLKAMRAEVEVDGVLGTYYFDVTYKPLRNSAGEIYAILDAAVDVTGQVVTRRKVEDSETKLRGLIAAAPAGIGLFVGRDLIIENPNQTFIDIVGKGPDIVGLPLREAMPELLTEGQPFLNILDDVFTTGVPFLSAGALVKIRQNGVLTDNYYNISYTPVYDANNEVYAILDIAIDVTEQIEAQKALEQTEAELRSAVELAELGTWAVDLPTRTVRLSARHADWLGLPTTDCQMIDVINCLEEDDRIRVKATMEEALLPGSDGYFEAEYAVINPQDGRRLSMHSLGRIYRDKDGQPVHVSGTTQDITLQRETRQALENQVRLRTDELAVINAELAANNAELVAGNAAYAAINDELQEANELLKRSNDNLQQFAYVASHDLQEPLRKIQAFGDLLRMRFDGNDGAEMDYVQRMQTAASRMSTLVRDLLSFSRIATQRDTNAKLALNDVIGQVLVDLDMRIDETGAQLTCDDLPVIGGDALQLGQLFQNLISNALKFHQTDQSPVIQLRYSQLASNNLPDGVKPGRPARFYHRIDVIDNGIGFDQKYADRIFQVFQRLHGKHEFAGTGIGLAICEKVVANHGGAITASSQPGQGSTFSVYLPA